MTTLRVVFLGGDGMSFFLCVWGLCIFGVVFCKSLLLREIGGLFSGFGASSFIFFGMVQNRVTLF